MARITKIKNLAWLVGCCFFVSSASAAKVAQTVELLATCENSADCLKLQIGFISTDFLDAPHLAQTNGYPVSHNYAYGPKNIKLAFYRKNRGMQVILDPSCVPLTRTPDVSGTLTIHVDYGSQRGQFFVTNYGGRHYHEAIPVTCEYSFRETT